MQHLQALSLILLPFFSRQCFLVPTCFTVSVLTFAAYTQSGGSLRVHGVCLLLERHRRLNPISHCHLEGRRESSMVCAPVPLHPSCSGLDSDRVGRSGTWSPGSAPQAAPEEQPILTLLPGRRASRYLIILVCSLAEDGTSPRQGVIARMLTG